MPARANRLDILDEVLGSVSARYFFDASGKLRVGRIQDPSGQTSVVTLTGDTEVTALSVKPLNQPQWRTRLGYERNWTVQPADRLAGSITAPNAPDPARVGWLGTEYRTAVYPPGAVASTGMVDPDRADTLIDTKPDAETEAQYRHEILGVQRQQADIEAHTAPFQLLPLDSFTVIDKRYGFESGQKMQLLLAEMFYLSNRSRIEAWF
ncbi:MAG: hypothetical protein GY862_17730 [Gammaproteobacteria bacterium]|nr:hypothetical protein [Gammaproteobacteria bacterium]